MSAASPARLLAIRKGSFKPDCTRSGRFVGARSSECIEIKDEDKSPGIRLNLRVGLSVKRFDTWMEVMEMPRFWFWLLVVAFAELAVHTQEQKRVLAA